jgi:hypothetical protein
MAFQPFASASRKRERDREGKKKRQHNQLQQLAVKLTVKMVNLLCTSSDAQKQPRQRKSIHGSQPSRTIKLMHYQQ